MKPLFETDTTMEDRFGKCPYATAQSLISGKWAILILHYLEDGPVRFNELQRLMPKMTHATLSVQLKDLVDKGLVERTQYESIPPKVEYSLTDMGRKFHPVIEALQQWGQEYIDFFESEQGQLRIELGGRRSSLSSRVWGRHAPTRTLQKRESVVEVQSRKGTTFSRIENLWPRDGSCPLRFPEFLKFHFSICLQIVDKLRLIRYDKSKLDTQPRRCNHDRRNLRPLFFRQPARSVY